jgi:ATP-dependent Clp protease protease subunit
MPYGIDIVNKSDTAGEIYIYGYITDAKWYDEDVTPSDFKKEMDKLKGKTTIDVFFNSGGGGVWAGMAIYNILKRATAETRGHVDGICASISSVILQACKTRTVAKNGLVMIHNPMSMAFGGAEEMRKTADLLDKVKTTIIGSYTERTKTGEEEIAGLMDAETWMTAEESVAFGFADEIDEAKEVKAAFTGSMAVFNGVNVDLAKYKAFPTDRVQVAPPVAVAPPAPVVPDYSIYDMEAELRNKSFNLFCGGRK